jgi:tRNA pseudouridine38-40 synthase
VPGVTSLLGVNVNVKLVVAYDGAGFHGFAANAGVRTVAGTLTEAISTVTRTPAVLTGAGRTDAGVHAWGQVISVELPDDTDLGDLTRRVNRLCAPTIAVRSAEVVSAGFDARFSARWRQYRYDVWNAPYPSPLITARAWHVTTPLDVDAMNDAAQHLVGEHEFASFCRRPKPAPGRAEASLVRNVLSAAWKVVDAEGPLLRFDIRANAFCHQMVRSIAGTLVDVGSGKLAADAVPAILAAGDRQAAGQVAPPQGLTLWQVGY